ncbi:MAG: SUMF1/EgtB/PvdO family nonheme iron enzyme, partial [Bacteroidota bacterium]
LEGLLIKLELAQFQLGPKRRLAIQQLLVRWEKEFSIIWHIEQQQVQAESLGYMLCPLIARNEAEQDLFYKIFKDYLQEEVTPYVKALLEAEDLPSSQEDEERAEDIPDESKWQWLFFLILFILPSIGVYFWFTEPIEPPIINIETSSCPGVGDSVTFQASVFPPLKVGESLSYRWEIAGKEYAASSAIHAFDSAGLYPVSLQVIKKHFWRELVIDTTYKLTINPRPKPTPLDFSPKLVKGNLSLGPDSLIENEELVYEWRIADNVFYGRKAFFLVGINDTLTIQLAIYYLGQREEIDCHAITTKTIDFNRFGEDAPLIPTPVIEPVSSEEGITDWVLWILFAWLGLLLVLWQIYRYLLRRFQESRSLSQLKEQFQAGEKPPYTLPLPSQEYLLSPEYEIYSLADALRQRKRGYANELDIPASVTATVSAAGLPEIAYLRRSAPSAYLVLIDKQAQHDHSARLFSMLMQVLQEEDVILERFYYEEDPRACYQEEGHEEIPLRMSLDQLYQAYGERRLLIYGDTSSVAHPKQARLTSWAVEGLLRWEERIWLTPKTPSEWGYTDHLVYQHFVLLTADLSSQLQLVETLSDEPPDYFQLKELARKEQSKPTYNLNELAGLEFFLGKELLLWVAATTIHPEPRWEVTLAIGKALEEELDAAILLTYANLYKLAQIPWLQEAYIPDELRKELAGILPEKVEMIARLAVLNMLEEVILPEEAFARQEHHIQMAVQRAILETDNKQAQQELLYLWETGHIDTPIPSLRKAQLRNSWLMGICYLLLAIVGFIFMNREAPPANFYSWGLSTAPDSAAYYNELGISLYQNGNPLEALSAWERAMIMGTDSASAQHNLELFTYNSGRILYNQKNFQAALLSWISLEATNILQTQKPTYAAGLSWAYLRDTLRAREVDSLTADSSWTQQRPNLASLLNREILSDTVYPPDSVLLAQASIADSLQMALLDKLDSPYPEVRAATLAILNSQAVWDSVVKVSVGNLLADSYRKVWIQAAVGILTHPPIDNEMLSLLTVVQQKIDPEIEDLLAMLLSDSTTNTLLSSNTRPVELIPDSSAIGGPISAVDTTTSPLVITDQPNLPRMVFIAGGTFQMGSNEGDDDEQPIHSVTLSDFFLAETEVTNAQFVVFLNDRGNQEEEGTSWYDPDGGDIRQDARGRWVVERGRENYPVINSNWYAARAYCQWLSEITGNTYRLPTEAEWEYAAGGGAANRTSYAGTNDEAELRTYGNYDGTGGTDTYEGLAPVRSFRPNSLGLYDMSGNVWEWCQHWYGSYPSGPQTDPTGPTNGDGRVLRGGSWDDDPSVLRVAFRGYGPSLRSNGYGFRPARTP